MQISEEVLEKIKEQNDIVDIISESVRLKKSGRNFTGLCPFHNERSPSFSVSPQKQIYKCFSCGEAGNVISFVMKNKNMAFIDSVKYLADKANIQLGIKDKKLTERNKFKDVIYKLNSEAGRFFFKNLMSNNEAKNYFINRGLKIETIKKFGLGYAKDNWHDLIFHFRKLGVSDDLLNKAGLISINDLKGSKYDRFRNRVMFPVFDYKGNVIGFGGRVLDDSKPKYLNSPETIVFQKGINLYGLNFALKNKINDNVLIIVEGYMDLIALHQYGITNVVASLGTALTLNQAKLLKRYCEKVIISYDSDDAGQSATLRGLEILRKVSLEVEILTIPQGKDPDDFIRSNGKEAFLNLLKNSEPLLDYRLKKAEKGINFKDSKSIVIYVKRVIEITNDLNAIEKDICIKKAAENTGLREQSLYDGLKNIKTNNNEFNFIEDKNFIDPAFINAERGLIKFILQDKNNFEKIKDKITYENFTLDEHKKIFNLIEQSIYGNKENISSYVESNLQDVDFIRAFTKIKEMNLFFEDNKDNLEKFINDHIDIIIIQSLKQKLDSLKKKQNILASQGKIEESINVAVDIININKKLKTRVH